mmetsp:Transcript_25395/g.59475  ORF Transcript_25395/g.59475 Transcript_25395/m.59475 type:complete len:344 (-) Transcript_25395:219-1250(-)
MESNHTVEDGAGRSKKLNRFIAKTYLIVNSDEPTVRWSHGGKSFLILDPEKFSQTVLPKFFKHNKFTSFVRQLNFYGFHKVRLDPRTLQKSEDIDSEEDTGDRETMARGSIVCFQHKFFQANQPKLLHNIQRATKQLVATIESDSPTQQDMERIQNQLREMTKKTDSLREEFDLKLAAAKIELEVDYLHRIKALEVCYADILASILGSRDSMAHPFPRLTKSIIHSIPTNQKAFHLSQHRSSSSSSSNSSIGSSQTILPTHSTPRDYLVDQLDRLSPLHQDIHRRNESSFRNMNPWSNRAHEDILKHSLSMAKERMSKSALTDGMAINLTTTRTLSDKLLTKD